MSLYNFYRSKEWEGLLKVLKVERVNAQGYIVCEHCGLPIVHKYDCIGHHTIELTEENYRDSSISLNPDNIKLVHHACHNYIHNKFGCAERKIYIVYGAPLAGKSSWVLANKAYGDLVIDLDSIWSAVSGCERYVKPKELKSVVFSVRDNLLESVKYRRGKWRNAYVIGGYPFEAERERLASELGAELIHIDTTRDECINRLAKCEDRPFTEWLDYINTYFLQADGGY